MLKVKIMGAGREVGRSSLLVDSGDKILLDHGVKLGPIETEFPELIRVNLNAGILSHAHLDHSGNLPHLFDYMHPLVFMTPPTLDLSRILWYDSIKITDKEGLPPVFTEQEIERLQNYAFPTQYKRKLNISDKTSFEFFDAGHIMGAALTKLYLGKKTLLYTGDFKAEETRLFPGADLKSAGKIDYLITESCYGDRDHKNRLEEEKRFTESVQETVDKGGVALIPAFAIGRSQEVIDVLMEGKFNGPIYFDGMGQKVARVFFDFPGFLKNSKQLKKRLNKASWVKTNKIRKEALKQPAAIVTTAGMLTGGPVYDYLPKMYADENSKIILTGFQVPETPGRILLEEKRISLNGLPVKVKCGVDVFDFSAHAGQTELLKAVKTWSPEKVILVHGDPEVEDVFQGILQDEGFDVFAPANGEQVKLE